MSWQKLSGLCFAVLLSGLLLASIYQKLHKAPQPKSAEVAKQEAILLTCIGPGECVYEVQSETETAYCTLWVTNSGGVASHCDYKEK